MGFVAAHTTCTSLQDRQQCCHHSPGLTYLVVTWQDSTDLWCRYQVMFVSVSQEVSCDFPVECGCKSTRVLTFTLRTRP